MGSLVSTSVINAILAGSTTITRRADIYESDGVTLFQQGTRVKDGNVSVDYTRVDRRNFDLTFDNSTEQLVHDPDNGLWYDKIVKVYRGLEYQNLKLSPSVAFLGLAVSGSDTIVNVFRRIGLNNLTFFPDISNLQTGDLLGFDIVVGYSKNADLSAGVSALLSGVFNSGGNVLSVSNYATSASIPLIATTAVRGSSAAWDVNPPVYDNLFFSKFATFYTSATNGETVITAVTSGTRVVGTTTFSSSQVPSVLAAQNLSGGQWLHYHPQINLNYTPQSNVGLFLVLFKAFANWLYTYGGTEQYEVQIGEFCIDKITEPRFPRDIKVSGRDYAKTLSLSKFDNTVTFVAGTSVDLLVQAEAANGGIYKTRLAGDGSVLPGDLTFGRSTDRMSAIIAICAAVNQEVFFDSFGFLVTRQFLDPATAPISLNLNLGGDAANITSMEKSSDDSRLFNRIICTGASAANAVQGLVYEGIAENHEPSSPTRIERIGERTDTVDMPTFTSDDQCLAWATSVLKVSALESYSLNYGSLVFPWIEAGEITQYVDTLNDTDPARYLLTNFNIPLGLAPQQGNAKRVSIVG